MKNYRFYKKFKLLKKVITIDINIRVVRASKKKLADLAGAWKDK